MKFAICNELFTDPAAVDGEPWTWSQQCAYAARTGYQGIEVAPFTLGETPTSVSQEVRNEMRDAANDAGLSIIGLHWLLAKTEGFHLTTDDAATRDRTGRYLAELAELSADLGGGVMVLGSPQQRNLEPGVAYERAEANAIETIRHAVPTLEARDVTLCLEPLGPNETDFMRTCESARRLIDAIDSASVQLHQDVKAMSHEDAAIPELIAEFANETRHFHANDTNLMGPGMGEVDFHPIFDALHRTKYDGYVSVEVFDYSAGATSIAEQSLAYMNSVWREITA